MTIEVDVKELNRLTNLIREQEQLIGDLQRRGTELVEENRHLKLRLEYYERVKEIKCLSVS